VRGDAPPADRLLRDAIGVGLAFRP
jgi:hypothetical protein